MGCGYSRISKSLSYNVLRKSVIGALIPEDDFMAFYSLCRTDIHTITSQVFINQNQLFFVVVAGDVVVNLTPNDSRPRVGLTHRPGDVIHFFHGTECTNSDGTISSGGLKLSLSFVTLTTPAVIMGVDRSSVEDFVRSRPHLTNLRTLLNLNLANFLTGPNSSHFRALTYKQLNILGPLLKLRLSVGEERIHFTGKDITLVSPGYQKCASTKPSVKGERTSILKAIQSPSSANTARLRLQECEALNNHLKSSLRAKQVYSPTFVVLHGLLESVELERSESLSVLTPKAKPQQKINIVGLLSSLRSNNSNSASSKYRKVHTADDESQMSQMPVVTIPKSPINQDNSGRLSGTASGVGGVGKQITPNSSQSPRFKSHPSGTIVGLEHFLAGKKVEGLPSLRVVGDIAILAHMDLEMLKILTSLDRRLQRVLSRNFVMKLLDSFRDHVPMIGDMDEKAYTMLCSTISLKTFNAGEIVYKQGDDSKFAYIIIHGSVMLTSEGMGGGSVATIKSSSFSPMAGGGGPGERPDAAVGAASQGRAMRSSLSAHPLVVEEPPGPLTADTKVLGTSGLFGEVALVTEVPYMSTTTALEPTLLVAISKAAFNEIYNNNKSTLAEIRIRMVGGEIGLQTVLDHPTGYKLFHEFVEHNRALENLQFYTSADKFDDMCVRLKKNMSTLRMGGVGGGSMKHTGVSGRMASMMFEDGNTVDLRHLLHSESLDPVGMGGSASVYSPTNKALETINEMQSVASEKTQRLDVVSEKHSVLTTLMEDDITTSRKHKGPLGTMVEEYESHSSPATVTGAVISPPNEASNGSVGGTFSNLSAKTQEEIELATVHKPQQQPDESCTSAGAQPLKSLKNGIRLTPLVVETSSNPHSNSDSPVPDFDDILGDNQDTYLAQGCNSNPSSLRIGSTSNANSVHRPAGNSAAAGAVAALVPEAQESPAREESSKMMKIKLLKVEKTTAELQEVAKSIMERYIYEGAPSEINIPSAMRQRTQQIFEDWVNKGSSTAGGGGAAGGVTEDTAPPGSLQVGASFTSLGASSQKSQLSPLKESMEFSFSSTRMKRHGNSPYSHPDFCDMFHEPKQEVLKLLKADLFVRWKHTYEFKSFIASMKPYEDVSLHSTHSRSSRGSHRKVANNNTSGVVSREGSFNKGIRALSFHR